MHKYRELKILALVVVLAVLVGAGGWQGLKWAQLKRADSMLSDANQSIQKANELMAQVRTGELGAAGFSSVENINRSAEAAGTALPLVAEARAETQDALERVRRARGLSLLPDWYPPYLEIKEETASLRLEQLGTLELTANSLQELYQSGEAIFISVEDMDRLLGRLQAGMGKLQNSPAESRGELAQVAADMRSVQRKLEEAHATQGFELLDELARSVGSNAELADAAAQLADAVAAGDQTQAQQAAVAVEKKLLSSGLGVDHLGNWWKSEIEPLGELYERLQIRQEELDAEAAAFYRQWRP